MAHHRDLEKQGKRMTLLRRALVVLLSVVAAAAATRALIDEMSTTVVTGQVVDAETGKPIPDALVVGLRFASAYFIGNRSVRAQVFEKRTDKDGRFQGVLKSKSFRLLLGSRRVFVIANAHKPVNSSFSEVTMRTERVGLKEAVDLQLKVRPLIDGDFDKKALRDISLARDFYFSDIPLECQMLEVPQLLEMFIQAGIGDHTYISYPSKNFDESTCD
jgi:hypothetical protein